MNKKNTIISKVRDSGFDRSHAVFMDRRRHYCCYKFKDEHCKYNGPEESCDKTRRNCIKLQGGLLNYGAIVIGDDPIISKGIK